MSVAKSYARALHSVAAESKLSSDGVRQLEQQLESFVKFIESSKELQVVLLGPITSAKEKVSLVSDLSKRLGLAPTLVNFLTLLARKGRLGLIKEIRDAFVLVQLESQGGTLGHLVSADPLDTSDIEDLSKAFSQKLGKRVAFQVSNDPSLLAGVKVTVNGVTYDGTLRSQLQRLRDRFFSRGADTVN